MNTLNEEWILNEQQACHFKADEKILFQLRMGWVCSQNQIRCRGSCSRLRKRATSAENVISQQIGSSPAACSLSYSLKADSPKPITSSCSAYLSIVLASGLPPRTTAGTQRSVWSGMHEQSCCSWMNQMFSIQYQLITFYFFVRALIQMCQANKICIS